MASSLVYSTAIVNVTIAVFFGHIIYRRLSSLSIIGLIIILPIIWNFYSKHRELDWLDNWFMVFFLVLQAA